LSSCHILVVTVKNLIIDTITPPQTTPKVTIPNPGNDIETLTQQMQQLYNITTL